MKFWYNTQDNTSALAVLSMADIVRTEPWFFQEKRIANWVLDYSFNNLGLFSASTQMTQLIKREAQVAHLYAPNTPYSEDTRQMPMPSRSAWVIFRGGDILQLDRLVDPTWGFAEIHDPIGELGALLVKGIDAAVTTTKAAGQFEALACLCHLAGKLQEPVKSGEAWQWRLTAEENDDLSDSDRVWLKRAQELIASHLTARLDLDKLAQEMCCSRSGFTQRFRKLSGESAGAYLLRQRIEAASALLDRACGLKEIARYTGFFDEFHLSKVFKKVTGLSPSEYREKKHKI